MTYVLFHVLLPSAYALACETHGHLGCGVVHEAAERWMHVVAIATWLALLLAAW